MTRRLMRRAGTGARHNNVTATEAHAGRCCTGPIPGWTFAIATLPWGSSVHAPNIHILHCGGLTVAQQGRRTTFAAGAVSFAVQHELWDGNIDDHSDQGVAILVTGQV